MKQFGRLLALIINSINSIQKLTIWRFHSEPEEIRNFSYNSTGQQIRPWIYNISFKNNHEDSVVNQWCVIKSQQLVSVKRIGKDKLHLMGCFYGNIEPSIKLCIRIGLKNDYMGTLLCLIKRFIINIYFQLEPFSQFQHFIYKCLRQLSK